MNLEKRLNAFNFFFEMVKDIKEVDEVKKKERERERERENGCLAIDIYHIMKDFILCSLFFI